MVTRTKKVWATCCFISFVSTDTKSIMRKTRYRYDRASEYREKKRAGILAVARKRGLIASVWKSLSTRSVILEILQTIMLGVVYTWRFVALSTSLQTVSSSIKHASNSTIHRRKSRMRFSRNLSRRKLLLPLVYQTGMDEEVRIRVEAEEALT